MPIRHAKDSLNALTEDILIYSLETSERIVAMTERERTLRAWLTRDGYAPMDGAEYQSGS
jgi:hypothetical protein